MVFFKFFSKRKDYENFAFGRPIPTNEDKIVLLMNTLKEDIDGFADKKNKDIENLLRILSEFYKHVFTMVSNCRKLEEELRKYKERFGELK